MVQNVSRGWLGALGLSAALLLLRCGGTPQVSSNGGVSSGGMDSGIGGTGMDTGGSTILNTGNQPGGGSAGVDTMTGDAGDSSQSDICGDGIVGKTEECDDGNTKQGDGCNGACKIEAHYTCPTAGKACVLDNTEVCGNGKKEGAEACDDGNAQNGDGCSSTCTVEDGYTCDPQTGVCTPVTKPAVCGNGLIEAGENCEDGNTVDHDGCTACQTDPGFTCPYAGQACIPDQYCGDGVLQVTLGEDCDDGNNKPGDGCDALCHTEAGYLCSAATAGDAGVDPGASGETCTKIWVCGNGIVDPHEACDDKGASGGCTADCKVVAGYTCSKDPTTGAGKCVSSPKSVCGNAIIEAGESCDDGNKASLDGCSATCKIEPGYSCTMPGMLCTQNERCGDGNLDQDRNEGCDDGNTVSGDGCTADCQLELNYTCPTPGSSCKSTIICGDGTISGTEQCDDGNKTDNDGCSYPGCQIQKGWLCPVAATRCVPAQCGDGIKVGSEQCDDGNATAGDGCSATCKLEPGFACVATNAANPSPTTPASACHKTVCGDGKVDPAHPGIGTPEGSEQCDLGDLIPYDGCSPTCTLETKCPGGTCQAVCGDGLIFPGEACDDGNNVDGDGCSADCKTIDNTHYACSTVTQANPTSLTIPILYRDMRYSSSTNGHPDFQNGAGSSSGLVQNALDANNKPVFNKQGGSLTTALNFCWWYNDVGCDSTQPAQLNPYDKLVYLDLNGKPTSLTLLPTVTGGAVFTINNQSFFPVDGLGWNAGSSPQTDYECSTSTNPHNFSFTSELHFPFTWQGGEKFDFKGDDDVWVFVNGKLAVDIGGVHGATPGSVTLSNTVGGNLGMTKNNIYEIAMFQAERHTCASTYQLTLSGFVHSTTQCVPKCGDGQLEGDEVCDDGKNDGSYGSCMPGCKARGPYCGDNKITDGEACDNGVNLTTYGNNSAQCGPNCQIAPYCGDGVISNGEQCDSGAQNGKTGDYGCQVGCKQGDRCGDGVVNAAYESCDDGVNNGTPGSACQIDCTPKCGNGTVDPGEACDLGTALNTGAYNGCNPDCSKGPYCGDGFQDPGEDCDDGKNDGAYGTCNPGCKIANYCGDGTITNPPETCDNGASNNINAYGKTQCTNRCLPAPYCGDKAVQASHGEKCDDGKNDGTPGSCAVDCSAYIPLASCGNGTLDANEQCDDGANNGKPTDTCDAHCHYRCGNGIVDSGEACDDGVNNGSYGTCNKDCTLAPYCGDGKVNGTEACDQGAANVALATAYGKTVCTSVCTKAPYCGDGRVQSAFEDCDGTPECSSTCTSTVVH